MNKEFDKAEIYPLETSIEYADDSIVSKTILKKETGTVTLFGFDKGQGLSKHSAPFDAIVQIIEGNANIIIDESSYQLSQGDMIIMPANIPHAVEASERFKMLLTMIKS